MNIRCCKGCEDRRCGCHATCEKYIKEKERINSIKQKEREENIHHNYLSDRKIETRSKQLRKYGRAII